MTLTQWFIFFLIIQILHGLATWKLYVKAGRKAWEAFVPVYNAIILMKIINRPWWWVILLFVPIVNLIMFPVVWVEIARSFGKNSYKDTVLAVLTLGFYSFYLNYVADISYIKERDINPKSSSGDWVSSILFAIVAATIVHTYIIQPFTIPTSSLEKTLLVGDFLFVSKVNYGARIPMTTVAAPMVHDTIPVLNTKSYLFSDEKNSDSWMNKLQLPYIRIPGFQSIKRNDIVVFNQPADTLYNMYKPADRYYAKPIDKKTNLVKRAVGLPGDSLEVRNGYVFINGKQNVLPERAKLQFSYYVQPKSFQFSPQQMKDQYEITDPFYIINNNNTYAFAAITDEAVARLKNNPNVQSITPIKAVEGERDGGIFPKNENYNWNNDFFGPLYIPKKGTSIKLTPEVLPLYKRVITEYEGHTVESREGAIYVDGKESKTYTFEDDYYWMMGDNRHNSLDSRAWGFVPFDHVVGKPVFIWMSWDGLKNPRWDRFFTTVGGSGQPVSYFTPFLLLIAIWFVYSKIRKRKKSAK
ncbi:signal peptidase I [Aegicerativicinus sediminis]|uniref:signal peptidase I n=1 Tax=Aegicerativicinus sediminis TaxID=2893202 RepID=UPI001E2D3FCA|nr:signal peptidase I [Aegicerativicinus sediminis]